MRRLSVLTYTTLFPNVVQPRHGIFVANRLQKILEGADVHARVVAPVPWFPSGHRRFGRYAEFHRVPREEHRDGIRVLHPRYLVVPKIGMSIGPTLLAAATRRCVRGLCESQEGVDLIDAHYFYPDGVAAAVLASRLKKPLVITARGSDINLLSLFRLPREQILWAARKAQAIVSVSEALASRIVELGIRREKIITLRNGVDRTTFFPVAKEKARAELQLEGKVLLAVGHLVENKGQYLLVEAMRRLNGFRLVLVGDGPMRSSLEREAREKGVAARVRFEGEVAHERLRLYYSASDALVLPSRREGMPNVVLEAMACGLPVVASRCGGIPEVVTGPEAGVLLEGRDAQAIAQGILRLFSAYPDRRATAHLAARFDWAETVAQQLALFRNVSEVAA